MYRFNRLLNTWFDDSCTGIRRPLCRKTKAPAGDNGFYFLSILGAGITLVGAVVIILEKLQVAGLQGNSLIAFK